MKKECPRSRKDNLVIQEMDGEVLIYDLNDNRAFCLNETSALIWQACDGKKSTAEIGEWVAGKLNSPINEDFIWLALNQLKREDLIENEVTVPIELEGLSRRQIIKKIGISSMLALPIVTSLVAPRAANAQSVMTTCAPTILGGACTCPNAIAVGGNCEGFFGDGTGCPGLGCLCYITANPPGPTVGTGMCA